MGASSTETAPPLRPEYGLYAGIFWGISRHELVAGAAEAFLTTKAQGEIQRIVSVVATDDRLRDLAGWADRIKRRGPKPGDDDETVAFLQDARNAKQDTWHYVNLPANVEIYDRARYPEFTRDDDVVQMTIASIDVLTKDSDRFSELNALRLLTHYVGDVHQPIHVGCAYIDRSTTSPALVLDPAIAVANNLKHDRGGGLTILPSDGGGRSLHEYWDGMGKILPTAAVASASESDLEATKEFFVQKLVAMVRTAQPTAAGAVAAAAADVAPRHRVVNWTATSLEGARQAYQSLQAIGLSGSNVEVSWEGKATYDARCRPIADRQLTLAAHNLAKLLNDIWA